MKKTLLGVLSAAALTCAASGQVVISQIYGGGGNSGAVFNRDFVELHNNGVVPVNIGDWSIQSASLTGAFGSANTKVDIPTGTMIGAGQYFLIALSQGANAGLPSLPTPDLDTPLSGAGTIAMSSTGAKVALVSSTAPVAAVPCPLPDAAIVDFVAFGAANCSEGTPAPATSNPVGVIRQSQGCQDTNNNSADFAVGTPTPRNTEAANDHICPGFVDCNNNGVPDSIDISGGASQDCNANSVPDECEIPSNDCNGNGQLDSCEIAANPLLDCNGNSVIDSCDIASGLLTDADGNGTADSCEGAAVTECDVNATVQSAGIRASPNGSGFFNIEGDAYGAFASYGALRWDVATAIARFDTDFGAGQWQITRAYLYFQQSNAAFTVDSLPDGMQLYYSNLDALDISVQSTVNPARMYPNFATDWTDADLVRNFTFTRGPGGSGGSAGSGTIESYSLYTLAGPNNSAMTSVGGDLNAASGALTLLVNTNDSFATATYAGNSNNLWRGPSLVLFAESTGGNPCDFADANCDGALNGFDVEAMEQAVNGDFSNYCLPTDDPNQDGASNGFDIEFIEGLINIC
ncbi:hypothetical protein PHYC_03438 [Phycisphaerales bacterium]|nr:hypothetical protein PHYC_03438 [Phycisphaerales bacterium]